MSTNTVISMPTKPRKRKSIAPINEIDEKPRQNYSTPRSRNLSTRTLAQSAPRTRQQTLTQINFVIRRNPDDEDVDLDYLEEEQPPQRKRRKTVSGTVTAGKTQARQTKRLVANGKGTGGKVGSSTKVIQNDEQVQEGQSVELGSLSPFTPIKKTKVVRTEIPSSQSPCDTPLSIRSRGFVRDCQRSPLKEKSVNPRAIKNGLASEIKMQRDFSLEVQDTFYHDDEEAQTPRRQQQGMRRARKRSKPEYQIEREQQSKPQRQGKKLRKSPNLEIMDSMDREISGFSVSAHEHEGLQEGARSSKSVRKSLVVKLPIARWKKFALEQRAPHTPAISNDVHQKSSPIDQDVYRGIMCQGKSIEDLPDNEFGAGAETQAALVFADLPSSDLSYEQAPSSNDVGMRTSILSPSSTRPLTTSNKLAEPSLPARQSPPRNPHFRIPLSNHPRRTSRTDPAADSSRLPPHLIRHSLSTLASAQLLIDLRRQANCGSNPNSSSSQSQDDTISFDPILPRNTISTSSSLLARPEPVPFSQATTVGLTQSSPMATRTDPPSTQPTLPSSCQKRIGLSTNPLDFLHSSSPVECDPPPKPDGHNTCLSQYGLDDDPSDNWNSAMKELYEGEEEEEEEEEIATLHAYDVISLSSSDNDDDQNDDDQTLQIPGHHPLTDSQMLPESLMGFVVPPIPSPSQSLQESW